MTHITNSVDTKATRKIPFVRSTLMLSSAIGVVLSGLSIPVQAAYANHILLESIKTDMYNAQWKIVGRLAIDSTASAEKLSQISFDTTDPATKIRLTGDWDDYELVITNEKIGSAASFTEITSENPPSDKFGLAFDVSGTYELKSGNSKEVELKGY